MSKTIRVTQETFELLERNAKGFETPSETIQRLGNNSEIYESLKLIEPVINGKIEILETEPQVTEQKAVILLHYHHENIKDAIRQIADRNTKYRMIYCMDAMTVVISIRSAVI